MKRERRSFSALGAGALCGVTYAGVFFMSGVVTCVGGSQLTANSMIFGVVALTWAAMLLCPAIVSGMLAHQLLRNIRAPTLTITERTCLIALALPIVNVVAALFLVMTRSPAARARLLTGLGIVLALTVAGTGAILWVSLGVAQSSSEALQIRHVAYFAVTALFSNAFFRGVLIWMGVLPALSEQPRAPRDMHPSTGSSGG